MLAFVIAVVKYVLTNDFHQIQLSFLDSSLTNQIASLVCHVEHPFTSHKQDSLK